MGTTYIRGATKADIIREILSGADKLEAKAVKGSIVWTVEETAAGHRFIGCYLLRSARDGWGYKPLSEIEHPYYYSCPLAYLDKVPEACAAWRAKVREYHARAKMKLAVGQLVRLEEGYSPAQVRILSVKPLRGEANGLTFRLRRNMIAEVVA